MSILNKIVEVYADDMRVVEAAKIALEKSGKIKQEVEKQFKKK